MFSKSKTPDMTTGVDQPLHNGKYSETSDAMQRFTATGRPYNNQAQENSFDTGMNSIMAADTFGNGNGPANILPVRYTDDSILMIPVMKVGNSTDAVKEKKKSKFSLGSGRRKSGGGSSVNDNFEMKNMTRGEYLKFYAKDEQGRFCGEREPASDCILKHPDDLVRWRGGQVENKEIRS